MKKFLSTVLVAGGVVLLTATFGFAEFTATGASSFPYFQLGCLIVGGLLMIQLRKKYTKIYTGEAIGAFALYTMLMALFTTPVIQIVKNILT